MFKRVTWVGVGFTLGVGTTVVAARKARQQLGRYKPNAISTRVTDRAIDLRDQVVDAVSDGRRAARQKEQELRARVPERRSREAAAPARDLLDPRDLPDPRDLLDPLAPLDPLDPLAPLDP